MRFARTFVLAFLSLLLAFAVVAQQTPTTVQRDAQALTILQQSVAAMASNVPADSSATGSVTIVEGSTTQTGTIQILTRGTGQTAENITLSGTQRSVIYSNGDAKEVSGTQSTNPPLQLIVTDQCPDFPLPLLSAILSNPDEALRYVGLETLDGASVQHVQVWNTFASKPRLKKLVSFSQRDLWFDSSSGLPLKITYSRRAGGGSVPAIPVEVDYSSFTNVSGVLYPFQINKSFNGTPWQTITIQTVSFNTGLGAAEFQVE